MKDGGQAFPISTPDFWESGMSLRDWFAGQALGACLKATIDADGPLEFGNVAHDAYALADAMLAAR